MKVKMRYGQDTVHLMNVYQILVREYLSIDTPYRGLLVYHGLDTGRKLRLRLYGRKSVK